MKTRDVLPRLAALFATKIDKFWDVPSNIDDPDYWELILQTIRQAQQQAQPDFEELHAVSIAALRDVLEAKIWLKGETRRAFDFIHLDLCITPLGLSAVRRRMEPMFEWIARSLVEEADIGRAVDIYSDVFVERIAPTGSELARRHGQQAALEWLHLLYYYARVTGGHRPLAEALESTALAIATRSFPEDPAITAAVSGLSWSIRSGREISVDVVRALRLIYDNRMCSRAAHKNLGVWFASGAIPGFPLDRRAEIQRVLQEHSSDLGFHEPLQLISAGIEGDVVEARRVWSSALVAVSSYNSALSALDPDRVMRLYEKERLFSLVAPLLFALIKGGDVGLATKLLALWVEIGDPDPALQIIYLLPNAEEGVIYSTPEGLHRAANQDHAKSFRQLVRAINHFFGINMVLNDDSEVEPHLSPRQGVPSTELTVSREFWSSIVSHYGIASAKSFLSARLTGSWCMRPLPYLPIPLQAVMEKEIGCCFPLSLTLQRSLPDRPVKRVLLWTAGTFQGQRQSAWMREVLEVRGVSVTEDDGSNHSTFRQHYEAGEFDAVWLLGHGEFSSDSPHESKFQVGPSEECTIQQWANWQVPEGQLRRLLVLDLCDSASVAMLNGAGQIGMAALGVRQSQAVIANLWPVVQFPSLVFHVLLAFHVSRLNYFEAYRTTLRTVAAGPSAIRSALVDVLGESHDAIASFDNQSFDWTQLVYWGAPCFYQ